MSRLLSGHRCSRERAPLRTGVSEQHTPWRVQLGADGLQATSSSGFIFGVRQRFASTPLDLGGPSGLDLGVRLTIEAGEQIRSQLSALSTKASLSTIICRSRSGPR